jgi:hypothetical protein
MPERIAIAIFDMARVVSFIADQMLPKSALPDAALAARMRNDSLAWVKVRHVELPTVMLGRRITLR